MEKYPLLSRKIRRTLISKGDGLQVYFTL